MAEKSLKPSIRFKGFTDAWEQRKLNDIATMHARIGWQNLRTSEFLEYGKYLLITGTDFENGTVNYATCHYVQKERYDQDLHIQVRNGSILITKDGTLGKVAYIQGLSMPATLNAGVFNVLVRNDTEVNSRYLFHFLRAPFLMTYVDKKATGGTIKHLNQSILVDFPVILPEENEQRKIGDLFSNLDTLITLHQRKYFYKKLTWIFIIHVFSFSWEQRKLRELCFLITKQTGFDYSETIKPSLVTRKEKDTYSFIQNKDFEGQNINLNTDFYIPVEVAKRFPKITLDGPAVLVSISGKIGNVGYFNLKNKAFIGGAVGICKLKKDNGAIIVYSLQSNIGQEYFQSLVKASSHANITVKDIRDICLYLPVNDKEEKKVEKIFSNLDTLITLHQRKQI